ncbi:hypothetical protein T12_4504 [Trichinella patagoniensis]|uniref:Uncharacterized protein n=1 Tax=Trichinella patagoniensis TaxID=990121 RepID=A0A0V0Z2A7_9BILA|nr:hypothetical protein T12_4504 [Trichinella patagoniensis]
MNVHTIESPFRRSSVMVDWKSLFRHFTAVKLCSPLAEAIGNWKSVLLLEENYRLANSPCNKTGSRQI